MPVGVTWLSDRFLNVRRKVRIFKINHFECPSANKTASPSLMDASPLLKLVSAATLEIDSVFCSASLCSSI